MFIVCIYISRERYSHIVTPLLVHAQRRLLDRISYFGGPPAPQPHFTNTEMITEKKVTMEIILFTLEISAWLQTVALVILIVCTAELGKCLFSCVSDVCR